LGEIRLGEMGLGEMGLGEMGQNRYFNYSVFVSRDFIEGHLLEFVNKNPGVVVYLQPRRHRSPKLVAEYREFL